MSLTLRLYISNRFVPVNTPCWQVRSVTGKSMPSPSQTEDYSSIELQLVDHLKLKEINRQQL